MMKKEDEDGKQLLTGITSNKMSHIRDNVIYSGSTLKEVKKKKEEEQKKRIDE